MAKLYPPQIEGTLPAFYDTEEKTEIVIPFIMNKTVGWTEIKGLIIKIKNIQNNELVTAIETDQYSIQTQQAYFQYDKNRQFPH
jgi:hypothetical protein